MENSLLAIFREIWPISLYYSTRTWPDFLATLKINKKIQFRSESTQNFYAT